MDVVAFDPFVTQEHAARLGIRLLPLDDLLKVADFVTVHVPKTKDTADMINTERLAMMKSDRAPDQLRARRRGQRAGAGGRGATAASSPARRWTSTPANRPRRIIRSCSRGRAL